jgi:hypothetical protein
LTNDAAVCRAWRINMAHDLENVDPVTNVPLAVQVCYNVAGLPYSFQADTYQDILSYQDGRAGQLLSSLCAFMWFTTVRCHRATRICVNCLSLAVVSRSFGWIR